MRPMQYNSGWPTLLLALLLIAAAGLLAACDRTSFSASEVAAQSNSAALFQSTPCRFAVPNGYRVDCGDVIVPEDYSVPHGRRVYLHTAIVHSTNRDTVHGPLLILYGGPGAYTLDRIDTTVEHFAPVLASQDLILFDQRGTGYSRPSLNCPEIDNLEVEAIDEQLSEEQAFVRRLAAYRQCRDRLERSGVDLNAYSASTLTSDIESLRYALGYQTWNLYGVSYGARQALLVMRDFPDGLHSVILDSVYPVDVDLAAETATMYDYALQQMFSANQELRPQFEQDFYALVDMLDDRPMHIPAIIPQRFILPYQSFDGTDLIRLMLRIVSLWPQSFTHMPGFIDDVSDGNYVDLMQLAKPSVGDQLFSEGQNLSVICQEINPATQANAIETDSSIESRLAVYARTDVAQRMTLCTLWLRKGWAWQVEEPVTSSIPTLVLKGQKDALVSAAWSTQATQNLKNEVEISLPEAGHCVVLFSPCARGAIAAFLRNPYAPTVEPCVD